MQWRQWSNKIKFWERVSDVDTQNEELQAPFLFDAPRSREPHE